MTEEETIHKDIVELTHSIESLEEEVSKTNSKKRTFWRGLLRGLGGAIGATILFALLVSLLSWFIASTNIPWVERAVENVGLSQVFDK